MVAPINEIMSAFLIECIRNSNDPDFDHLCVATLKQFAFDEMAVSLIREAFVSENWSFSLEGKEFPVILNFKEKVSFIKLLCSSPHTLDIERQAFKERTYALLARGSVFNDLVNRLDWGTPDAEKKAQLWDMITDPFNEDNLQNYYWKEDAFCQWNCQEVVLAPYQDLFYKVVPMLVNFQSHTKATRFLRNNSPASRALP